MRSIFFGFAAVAFAAEDCQVADEGTMLQIGRNTMRKMKTAGSKDAKAMLKDMREIANSLVEGSDSTTSQDVLTDSLDAVQAALTELRQATLQQVANAQQQIIDASGGFQACTTNAGLRQSVEQRAAAVESCQNTLDQLRTAETQQCATADDCLCDEARVRTTSQEALCTAMTETYELAFCEHHHICTTSQQCHSIQDEVYQRLTADVQAEMALVEQEYIAVEQSICLNRLSREAMTPPRTRIPRADLDACDDVDVSALSINYPATTAPPTCPASTQGDPQCHPNFSEDSGQCRNAASGALLHGDGMNANSLEHCLQNCDENSSCLAASWYSPSGRCKGIMSYHYAGVEVQGGPPRDSGYYCYSK